MARRNSDHAESLPATAEMQEASAKVDGLALQTISDRLRGLQEI
jgi:hypothetical protein